MANYSARNMLVPCFYCGSGDLKLSRRTSVPICKGVRCRILHRKAYAGAMSLKRREEKKMAEEWKKIPW